VVFTYNIANGLTAGLAFHPIVKIAAGRAREVRPRALGTGRHVVSLPWLRAPALIPDRAFNGMDLASRASAPTRRS
jgi:xanthine/uracil/vitamin C permease (AzgA family)